MDTRLRQWLIFGAGAVLTVFLLWFGFRMLLADVNPSSGTLYLLGTFTVLGGVFAVSSQMPQKLAVGTALVVTGLYFFARASGQIEGAWLLRILGAASVGAAGLIFYIVFMQPKADQKNDRAKSDAATHSD